MRLTAEKRRSNRIERASTAAIVPSLEFATYTRCRRASMAIPSAVWPVVTRVTAPSLVMRVSAPPPSASRSVTKIARVAGSIAISSPSTTPSTFETLHGESVARVRVAPSVSAVAIVPEVSSADVARRAAGGEHAEDCACARVVKDESFIVNDATTSKERRNEGGAAIRSFTDARPVALPPTSNADCGRVPSGTS